MPRENLRFGYKVYLTSDDIFTRHGVPLRSTNNPLHPLGVPSPDFDRESQFGSTAPIKIVSGYGEIFGAQNRRIGEEITFGQVVRLLHVATNSYICMSWQNRASLEKANHKVSLEYETSPEIKHSRWRILPRYKIRSEGQKVCNEDVIILQSVGGEYFLHIASEASLSGHGAGSSHIRKQLEEEQEQQRLFQEQLQKEQDKEDKQNQPQPPQPSLVQLAAEEGPSSALLRPQPSLAVNFDLPPDDNDNNNNNLNAASSGVFAPSASYPSFDQFHTNNNNMLRTETTDSQKNSPAPGAEVVGDSILEINGSSTATGFKINFYDMELDLSEADHFRIRCGDCLQFFHREHSALVSSESIDAAPYLDPAPSIANGENDDELEEGGGGSSGGGGGGSSSVGDAGNKGEGGSSNNLTSSASMTSDAGSVSGFGAGDDEGTVGNRQTFPSTSLFVIEQVNVFRGGYVYFGRNHHYRLKCLSTGLFLCVRQKASRADQLYGQEDIHPTVSTLENDSFVNSPVNPLGSSLFAPPDFNNTNNNNRRSSNVVPALGSSLNNDEGQNNNNNFSSSASTKVRKTKQQQEDDITSDSFEFVMTANSSEPGTRVCFTQAGDDPQQQVWHHSRIFVEFPFVVNNANNNNNNSNHKEGVWLSTRDQLSSNLLDQAQSNNNNSNSQSQFLNSNANNNDSLSNNSFGSMGTMGSMILQQNAAEQLGVVSMENRQRLTCASHLPDKDGIEILKVPFQEFQELNSVVAVIPPLEKLRQNLLNKNSILYPPMHLLQHVRDNLASMICMCTISKERNPLTRDGPPDNNAQQRLIDQRVIHLVLDVVELLLPPETLKQMTSSPTNENSNNISNNNNNHSNNTSSLHAQQSGVTTRSRGSSIFNNNNKKDYFRNAEPSMAFSGGKNRNSKPKPSPQTASIMFNIVQLGFRLIRQCASQNEKTSYLMKDMIPRIFEYCSHPKKKVGATDALAEIFRDHPALVDTPDDLTNVNNVIKLVAAQGRSSNQAVKVLCYLSFCTRGIRAVQNKVSEELIAPAVSSLILSETGQLTNTDTTRVRADAATKSLVSSKMQKATTLDLATEPMFYKLYIDPHDPAGERICILAGDEDQQQKQLQAVSSSSPPTLINNSSTNNNDNDNKSISSNGGAAGGSNDNNNDSTTGNHHQHQNKNNNNNVNLNEEFDDCDYDGSLSIEDFIIEFDFDNVMSGGGNMSDTASRGSASQASVLSEMEGGGPSEKLLSTQITPPACLLQQLLLAAASCADRHEVNIRLVRLLYPFKILFTLFKKTHLPGEIRAAALGVIQNAYVNVEPLFDFISKSESPVYVWDDIIEKNKAKKEALEKKRQEKRGGFVGKLFSRKRSSKNEPIDNNNSNNDTKSGRGSSDGDEDDASSSSSSSSSSDSDDSDDENDEEILESLAQKHFDPDENVPELLTETELDIIKQHRESHEGQGIMEMQSFLLEYLVQHRHMTVTEKSENCCILAAMMLLKNFLRYGWIDLDSYPEWLQVVIEMLDGRGDVGPPGYNRFVYDDRNHVIMRVKILCLDVLSMFSTIIRTGIVQVMVRAFELGNPPPHLCAILDLRPKSLIHELSLNMVQQLLTRKIREKKNTKRNNSSCLPNIFVKQFEKISRVVESTAGALSDLVDLSSGDDEKKNFDYLEKLLDVLLDSCLYKYDPLVCRSLSLILELTNLHYAIHPSLRHVQLLTSKANQKFYNEMVSIHNRLKGYRSSAVALQDTLLIRRLFDRLFTHTKATSLLRDSDPSTAHERFGILYNMEFHVIIANIVARVSPHTLSGATAPIQVMTTGCGLLQAMLEGDRKLAGRISVDLLPFAKDLTKELQTQPDLFGPVLIGMLSRHFDVCRRIGSDAMENIVLAISLWPGKCFLAHILRLIVYQTSAGDQGDNMIVRNQRNQARILDVLQHSIHIASLVKPQDFFTGRKGIVNIENIVSQPDWFMDDSNNELMTRLELLLTVVGCASGRGSEALADARNILFGNRIVSAVEGMLPMLDKDPVIGSTFALVFLKLFVEDSGLLGAIVDAKQVLEKVLGKLQVILSQFANEIRNADTDVINEIILEGDDESDDDEEETIDQQQQQVQQQQHYSPSSENLVERSRQAMNHSFEVRCNHALLCAVPCVTAITRFIAAGRYETNSSTFDTLLAIISDMAELHDLILDKYPLMENDDSDDDADNNNDGKDDDDGSSTADHSHESSGAVGPEIIAADQNNRSGSTIKNIGNASFANNNNNPNDPQEMMTIQKSGSGAITRGDNNNSNNNSPTRRQSGSPPKPAAKKHTYVPVGVADDIRLPSSFFFTEFPTINDQPPIPNVFAMPVACLRQLSQLIRVADAAMLLPEHHAEDAEEKLDFASRIRVGDTSQTLTAFDRQRLKLQQKQNLSLQDRWHQYIDDFVASAAGTIEETMFRTPARLVLRRAMLGHRAVKAVVRTIESSSVSRHERKMFLAFLRQILVIGDEEFSDAVLILPTVLDIDTGDGETDERILWQKKKRMLSLDKSLEERQNIFASWKGDALLPPKLIRFVSKSQEDVTRASLLCAVAMLEGGNRSVQQAVMRFFLESQTESFFSVTRYHLLNLRDNLRERLTMIDDEVEDQNLFEPTSDIISEIDEQFDFSTVIVLIKVLQLLNEGHFSDMQNYIRVQPDNQISINLLESLIMVFETVLSAEHGIDFGIFDLMMQTIATITETIQGPCHGSQRFCIAQNAGGLVTKIFSTHHKHLDEDQVHELHNAAMALLQSLLEGHTSIPMISMLCNSLTMSTLARRMDDVYDEWKEERSVKLFNNNNNKKRVDKSAGSEILSNLQHGHQHAHHHDDDDLHHHGPNHQQINHNNNHHHHKSHHHHHHKSSSIKKAFNFCYRHTRKIIDSVFLPPQEEDELNDSLNLACSIFIFMKSILDIEYLLQGTEKGARMSDGGGGGGAGNDDAEGVMKFFDREGLNMIQVFRNSSSFEKLSRIISTIEILRNGKVERCYFRVPKTCRLNLQEETKKRLVDEVARSGDGARLGDFFDRSFNILNELDFYDKMMKTRGLSLIHRWAAPIELLALLSGVVINLILLAAAEWPNSVLNEPHLPEGAVYQTYTAFGIINMILQVVLIINFYYGPMKIYLAENWSNWQEDRNKKAIQESKKSLSVIPPKIEDNAKKDLSLTSRIGLNIGFGVVHAPMYRYAFFTAVSFLGFFISPVWYCFSPLLIVWHSPQLFNVILSITKNKGSLLVTFLFLLVCINAFSVLAYYNYSDVFNEDNFGLGYTCDTMVRCLTTMVLQGLKHGGGISEVASPAIYRQGQEGSYYLRMLYDLIFFILLILLLMNLFLGLILDTFGQLREEREFVEEDQENKCFICGIPRDELDKITAGGFEHHVSLEHKMWDYVAFMKFLTMKEASDQTGIEGYVWECMSTKDPKFFPIGRALVKDFASADSSTLARSLYSFPDQLQRQLQQEQEQEMEAKGGGGGGGGKGGKNFLNSLIKKASGGNDNNNNSGDDNNNNNSSSNGNNSISPAAVSSLESHFKQLFENLNQRYNNNNIPNHPPGVTHLGQHRQQEVLNQHQPTMSSARSAPNLASDHAPPGLFDADDDAGRTGGNNNNNANNNNTTSTHEQQQQNNNDPFGNQASSTQQHQQQTDDRLSRIENQLSRLEQLLMASPLLSAASTTKPVEEGSSSQM